MTPSTIFSPGESAERRMAGAANAETAATEETRRRNERRGMGEFMDREVKPASRHDDKKVLSRAMRRLDMSLPTDRA